MNREDNLKKLCSLREVACGARESSCPRHQVVSSIYGTNTNGMGHMPFEHYG